MPYVAGGQSLTQQSPWRVSIVYDLFWGLVNVVVLFFQTMIQPDLTSKGRGMDSSYSSRPGTGPGGPGGPRRRMGGFRGGAGSPSPPPAAGGG
uniref:selenoprotein K-like n=1 Tax=Styela clava TaxID=7725 RepID=UPI00193A69D1|nr:selenoprotein K-like [Styela clava]